MASSIGGGKSRGHRNEMERNSLMSESGGVMSRIQCYGANANASEPCCAFFISPFIGKQRNIMELFRLGKEMQSEV